MRIYAGPVTAVTVLQTGDMYGGNVKFSSFRCYIAGFYYHSYDACCRVTGAYITRCRTYLTTEPKDFKKWNELKTKDKAALFNKVFGAVCPLWEIGFGVLSFIVMLPLMIYAGLQAVGKKFFDALVRLQNYELKVRAAKKIQHS